VNSRDQKRSRKVKGGRVGKTELHSFIGRITWYSSLWQQRAKLHQGLWSSCSYFTSLW